MALVLTLGPTCALAYLGYRDLARRERDLAVTYAATATVLRDRVTTEIRSLRLTLPSDLPSTVDATRLEAVQAWLKRTAASHPWAANLHVVLSSGIIVTPSLSHGWTTDVVEDPAISTALQRGEDAEFKRQDLDGALEAYRAAASASRTPALTAACQARLGRTLFKLRRYDDGIVQYRAVMTSAGETATRYGLPYVALALEEIADGLDAEGRTVDRTRAFSELLTFLVDKPWDIAAGYGFHLRRTLDRPAPGIDPTLVTRGRNRLAEVAEVERLAELPGANEKPSRTEVRYRIRREYVQSTILPRVASASALGDNLRADFASASEVSEPVLAVSEPVEDLSGARLRIVDAAGRSLEQLSLRERWTYGGLLGIVVVVLLSGVVITIRAWTREAELSKLRTDFVSNVSHELKTPLALIRMFGETLESGIVADPSKQHEFYGIIRRESERLTHLINNVLDTARIEAGTKEFNLHPGNIVPIVREAVDAYSALFTRLDFEVRATLPETSVTVQFDRDAIAQALVNLFQNAIRYSDQSRRVDVAVSADSREAVVSVKDCGIGIPASELPKIFDKFYRSRSARGDASSGSGLGLSIVRHVMQAHGGRVDVHSVVGLGTEFAHVFPLANRST